MPMAEVNGVKLHYETAGDGTPLICIHPPLLTGEIFNYQKQQLAPICRIITFDVRGHGRSEPSSLKLDYTLITKDIVALMDHLDLDQAYLCGYSTGGSVAMEAMLRYPDRFLGGILISSMSEMTDLYNKGRAWAASVFAKLKATKLLTAAITWGNADTNRTFRELLRCAVVGDRLHLHQYFEACCQYHCTSRLRDIHVPVLLVYGEKDRSFHRYARILHQQLPDSQLHYIPGAKHQIPTKNPDALTKLIRAWFAELSSLPESPQHNQLSIQERSLEAPVHPAPLGTVYQEDGKEAERSL